MFAAQALQKAGLCGPHSSTRLLVLCPHTLADVLDSILEVCFPPAQGRMHPRPLARTRLDLEVLVFASRFLSLAG